MGAHDYIRVFKTESREEVKKKWQATVDDDRHESGGGAYAGNATTMHGTITFKDLKLKGESEAREHILDKHEKWTGPLAVSFLLPAAPGERDKARAAKALAAYEKVAQKRLDVAQAIQAAFVSRKAKLVTCDGCTSKLSREHLVKKLAKGRVYSYQTDGPKQYDMPGVPACPVCNTSLLSETDRARLDAHATKHKEATKERDEASKPTPSDKIGWAVGGWAAS